MASATNNKLDMTVATHSRARTVSQLPHSAPIPPTSTSTPTPTTLIPTGRGKRRLDNEPALYHGASAKRPRTTLPPDYPLGDSIASHPQPRQNHTLATPAPDPNATGSKAIPLHPHSTSPISPQTTQYPYDNLNSNWNPNSSPSSATARGSYMDNLTPITTGKPPSRTVQRTATRKHSAGPVTVSANSAAAAAAPPRSTKITLPPRTSATNTLQATGSPSSLTELATGIHVPVIKSRAKARNGLKHELDRLGPSDADKNVEGGRGRRKLRSQENPRLKSDLSIYFSEYDQIIGNDPKVQQLLELDSTIELHDSRPLSGAARVPDETVLTFSDDVATNYKGLNVQEIDFSFLEKQFHAPSTVDILPDSTYETNHMRQERSEKNIRNIEKNKAQHEKERVERILADLQGQNWLRVLGIHSVTTEARLKQYQPARQYFINGCQNLLAKYKEYVDYEKGKRVDRRNSNSKSDTPTSRASLSPGRGGSKSRTSEDKSRAGGKGRRAARPASRSSMRSLAGDDSDVDLPAKQLREESAARSGVQVQSRKVRNSHGGATKLIVIKRPSMQQQTEPQPEPEPPQEFTSFFSNPHQREAALKGRRTRNRMAWGHLVAEAEEKEFELPEEFLDKEAFKGLARRRRQARREKRDAAGASK